MAVQLRLYNLSGKMTVSSSKSYESVSDALEAAKTYAEPKGFTDIKVVRGDDPFDGFRITGTTPNGRHGRNIGIGDWDY